MEGVFACPECGSEIRIKGLSPGRVTRCAWCSAKVEVPFLPRAETIRRHRFAKTSFWKLWPPWVWVLIVILCMMIGVAGTNRWLRTRWEAEESGVLAKLLSSSESLEKSERLSEALVELEGALALIKKRGVEANGNAERIRTEELQARRDRLAAREAIAELRTISETEAANDLTSETLKQEIGKALNLLARTRSDSALAELEPKVVSELDRLRTSAAEKDGLAARRAFESGDFVNAAELSERQYQIAEQVPINARLPLQTAASTLVGSIIKTRGILMEWNAKQLTLGASKDYAGLLNPSLQQTLAEAGYFPKPSKTVFEDLWNRSAPFRIVIEIKERQDGRYFQSPNRLSYIDAHVELFKGEERLSFNTLNGQTQVPLPGLPAYVASRAAVSEQRSPQFEKLLYDNARTVFVDRLRLGFKSLPKFARH